MSALKAGLAHMTDLTTNWGKPQLGQIPYCVCIVKKKPLFPVSKRFGGIEKESYFNATKSGILQSPRQYGVTWVFPKYTKGVRNLQWVEYECSVAWVNLKCSVYFKICMWFWLQGCIKGHSIALHENVQYVKSQTLWVVIYLWFPKSILNHFL